MKETMHNILRQEINDLNLDIKTLNLSTKLSMVEYKQDDINNKNAIETAKQNFKLLIHRFESGACANITNLDLSWNGLDNKYVIELAKMLKIKNFITKLNLSWNNIDDITCGILAEIENITDLNLSNNSIEVDGAVALANMIKKSNTLTSLNLWNNTIGTEGAKALEEGMKENNFIIRLDLTKTGVGQVPLDKMLARGSEYVLMEREIGYVILNKINEYIQRNIEADKHFQINNNDVDDTYILGNDSSIVEDDLI